MDTASDATKGRWILRVLPEIAGGAAFLVTYFIDPLSFGSNEPLAAVPSVLFAVLVLLIGHGNAIRKRIDQALSRSDLISDEICEAVKNNLHVTQVGNATKALDYITNRIPSLVEVRGTVFNFEDEWEIAEEQLYDTESYRRFEASIGPAVARQLRWKDIGDDTSAERFRRVGCAAEENAGKEGRHRYQYRLLQHTVPQMNFIVLDYSDDDKEVLFNWDYRSLGHEPNVLLTRDRDIVHMFTVQFELLWRAGSPDHDSSTTRSTS